MLRRPAILAMISGLGMLAYSRASAQEFGGTPFSVRWRQIRNDGARIIFPEGLGPQAARVSAITARLDSETRRTIGPLRRPVNIVFRNQTTISNGYVQLAPFRSEFQIAPEQNSFELGTLPFYSLLGVHEYRHVQQYANLRVGFARFMSWLFGEEGQALANDLTVPNWFFEGDAVYQETLVSPQGRGRLPFFFNGYRSLWLSEKNYSWMKLRNGSLRDYTPDHYPVGYMLVAYGRERYGADFWRGVARDAAAFRPFFYPLQKAIRAHTGMSFTAFHDSALAFFRAQLPPGADTAAVQRYAAAQKHFSADEEFPQFGPDGDLVYVKTTYRRAPAFVRRDAAGRETRIRMRAVSLDNQFSLRGNLAVYAAYEPDIRWGWKDYSVLRVLDLATGADRRITARSKLYAPDLSADGKRIVAVERTDEDRCALVILDAATGRRETTIPNPGGYYFTYPKFSDDDHFVSAVRDPGGRMALGIFDSQGGVRWLTDFGFAPIGFPSVSGDRIYFTASENGTDRLFAVTPQGLLRENDSLPGTGHYEANAAAGRIAWTSFTSAGYRIESARNDDARWTAAKRDDNLTDARISSLETAPRVLPLPGTLATAADKKYPRFFQPLNFHSWRPYIDDPDYSLSLVGENVLGTVASEIFAGYNRNEGYGSFGADFTYAGLFPWIDAGGEYLVGRNAIFRDRRIYWNEWQTNAGLSVPLNLSRGQWLTSLTVGSDLVWHQRIFRGVYKDSFDTRGYASVDPSLVFTNQVQSARQRIYPAWAQTLVAQYDRAVTTFSGWQFLASGYLYFPGLVPTHSLVLAAAFQQRDSLNELRFSNNFPGSRGYSGENFYRMYRLAANYHFPLVYPDWGFGNLVYCKRIRANAFYDYTGVPYAATNGPYVQRQYRSTGAEIYFDTQWWNQLAVTFGFRYSRLLDPDYEGRGPNQWEFILPLNLLSR